MAQDAIANIMTVNIRLATFFQLFLRCRDAMLAKAEKVGECIRLLTLRAINKSLVYRKN